jgi:hypothetical protein
MSPTYVTRYNGHDEPQRKQGSEETLSLDLHVRSIRIRHGEVSLFDEKGRESVLIVRGTHPGAGISVDVAHHVTIG